MVVGTIAALYFTREILIPFAFALTLSFLLTPAVALLERLRFGRVASVLATLTLSIAVAAAAGWIIASQLVEVANELPHYRRNIEAKVAAFRLPSTGQFGRAAASVEEVVRELSGPAIPPPSVASPRQGRKQASPQLGEGPPLPVRVVEPGSNAWSEFRAIGAPVLAPLGQALMVVIFTVFILLNREDLRNRLLRLAGLGQLNVMTQALDDASGRVSRYLSMQFLVNAGFGTMFGLGLFAIGVPYPALWGALAGILRIVPYVGTLTAAMLPLALSLAVFDGWLRPSLVFALVGLMELIVGNAVEPWLYGARVGISSLALLVTSVFWAVLWGPAGLILSTPLTVCVVVLGRYVPQLSFLHIMLGDEQVLAAEAQIYQRLLARDQAEAQSVARNFLKGRSLIELYDLVLIPALSMAEQDRHQGTIDAGREEFLFLSVNEMIAEFAEFRLEGDSTETGSPAAPDSTPHKDARILCVPAHDRADEVTAAMVSQLLEREGYATISFPLFELSPTEWLEMIEAGPGDIVCISSLPPYAFSPARTLCRQIRERFPQLKIVVCVWGFGGDTQKAMARFERTPPDRISTSLADAVKQVGELAHPSPESPVAAA